MNSILRKLVVLLTATMSIVMLLGAYGFIVPFALAMLGLEELRKWFVRSRRPRGAATFSGQKQCA